MGKLITVIGNSGVGKSTFTKALCKAGSFSPILETMEERPFIWKFHENRKRYVVANQVDYFLYQAEQEHQIRLREAVGIQDGGLDFGFHVFTKRFYQKGYLEKDEYQLLGRLYEMLRGFLPYPDLIIELFAPISVVTKRMVGRKRDLDIEVTEDLYALEALKVEWLDTIKSTPIIQVDASTDDPSYSSIIKSLFEQITENLGLA